LAKDRGGPPIPPIAPCTGITTNQNNVNGISRNHHRRPTTIHRSFLARREFLRNSAVLAAGLAIPQTNARKTEIIARPLLDLTWFPHFVDTLPIPQVIKPTGRRPIHRPNCRALRQRTGMEGHCASSSLHGHPHHHRVRRLRGPLRLALPHPRTRRQRNDAPLRHRLRLRCAVQPSTRPPEAPKRAA